MKETGPDGADAERGAEPDVVARHLRREDNCLLDQSDRLVGIACDLQREHAGEEDRFVILRIADEPPVDDRAHLGIPALLVERGECAFRRDRQGRNLADAGVRAGGEGEPEHRGAEEDPVRGGAAFM
jgi:hypothetical protein